MDVFEELARSLNRFEDGSAFHIGGEFFTYRQLRAAVAGRSAWVRARLPKDERIVAVMAHDDLLTYASILALWSDGRAYLPLSPKAPEDRNRTIVERAGVRTVLVAGGLGQELGITEVRTDGLPDVDGPVVFEPCALDELAYVLFTSGTTGVPKGVAITRGNLQAFVEAYGSLGIQLDQSDRCLQMFELTFDVSVMSYLMPLLAGACVHTVPPEAIKFLFIADLLAEQRLTMAAMVPSVITYLRPYFGEMSHPDLRHCVFAGEALPLELTEAWAACVPNARIINAYGPTEHTIVCTEYVFDRQGGNKERNGILSIGRAMQGSRIVVIDEDRRILPPGSKGELCLSGPQLTRGYLNDPERTSEVMFHAVHEGVSTRFYRTGDLCLIDVEGDIMYLGRIDQQAKIQGFRVELTEVEHHARGVLRGGNVAALAIENHLGLTEIALVIESREGGQPEALQDALRRTLPPYMVPTRVHYVPAFPLGSSGKTDRGALRRMIPAVG